MMHRLGSGCGRGLVCAALIGVGLLSAPARTEEAVDVPGVPSGNSGRYEPVRPATAPAVPVVPADELPPLLPPESMSSTPSAASRTTVTGTYPQRAAEPTAAAATNPTAVAPSAVASSFAPSSPTPVAPAAPAAPVAPPTSVLSSAVPGNAAPASVPSEEGQTQEAVPLLKAIPAAAPLSVTGVVRETTPPEDGGGNAQAVPPLPGDEPAKVRRELDWAESTARRKGVAPQQGQAVAVPSTAELTVPGIDVGLEPAKKAAKRVTHATEAIPPAGAAIPELDADRLPQPRSSGGTSTPAVMKPGTRSGAPKATALPLPELPDEMPAGVAKPAAAGVPAGAATAVAPIAPEAPEHPAQVVPARRVQPATAPAHPTVLTEPEAPEQPIRAGTETRPAASVLPADGLPDAAALESPAKIAPAARAIAKLSAPTTAQPTSVEPEAPEAPAALNAPIKPSASIAPVAPVAPGISVTTGVPGARGGGIADAVLPEAPATKPATTAALAGVAVDQNGPEVSEQQPPSAPPVTPPLPVAGGAANVTSVSVPAAPVVPVAPDMMQERSVSPAAVIAPIEAIPPIASEASTAPSHTNLPAGAIAPIESITRDSSALPAVPGTLSPAGSPVNPDQLHGDAAEVAAKAKAAVATAVVPAIAGDAPVKAPAPVSGGKISGDGALPEGLPAAPGD